MSHNECPMQKECPWTPERWEKLGDMGADLRAQGTAIENVSNQLKTMDKKIDSLNFICQRGILAGIGGGGSILFLYTGWLWFKGKLGM